MPHESISFNPLSQLVVRLTNPLLSPLRTLLPASGRVDWAAWVLAMAVQVMILVAIALIAGETMGLTRSTHTTALGVIGVLGLLVNFYFFTLIAMIVVSWIAPGSRHPGHRADLANF